MNSPEDLKNWLVDLFPSFANEWEKNEVPSTLHEVFFCFTPYFGSDKNNFTKKQLKKLGDFINKSVINDDNLENAISTCFLEHLHQINSYKLLSPYLTNRPKRKSMPNPSSIFY